MKRTVYITLCILSGICLASCNMESITPEQTGQEVVLSMHSDDISLETSTKATAVTSMPSSLYWCATTGTSGTSDSQKYAPTSSTVSAGKIATGKYQTATPTAYNWYVSNVSMNVASSGPTISASNTTDVISGVKKADNTATPSVTLNHVFARTGTLTLNTQTGYTLSSVSWKIESNGEGGTAGTYNMSNTANDKTNWSSRTALAKTAITSSSDMYLIPGSYKFTISYTLTKGDYTQSYTKSGNANLVAGKINNITATANGGAAEEIIIGLTLTPWGTTSVSVSELEEDGGGI